MNALVNVEKVSTLQILFAVYPRSLLYIAPISAVFVFIRHVSLFDPSRIPDGVVKIVSIMFPMLPQHIVVLQSCGSVDVGNYILFHMLCFIVIAMSVMWVIQLTSEVKTKFYLSMPSYLLLFGITLVCVRNTRFVCGRMW